MGCHIMALFVLAAITTLGNAYAYEDTCSDESCSLILTSLEKIQKNIASLTPVLDLIGELPVYAATSCQQIAYLRKYAPSGLYWIQSNKGPAHVFCDMNNQQCGGGVWTRIADIDMSSPRSTCPRGLKTVTSPKRSCQKTVETGGSSAFFHTYGIPYSKVCGKVIAYQKSTPDAFEPYHKNQHFTVDKCYADGVLLSYGSPREHIWTFAATTDSFHQNRASGCPCGNGAYHGTIPSFVGHDYFCETAVHNERYQYGRIYTENFLWDGTGHGTFPHGCEGTRNPWFMKEFAYGINSDIELRICMDQDWKNEDVLLEKVYLYVQ